MQVLEQLRAVRLHSGPVEGSRGYLSQPFERERGTLLSCHEGEGLSHNSFIPCTHQGRSAVTPLTP